MSGVPILSIDNLSKVYRRYRRPLDRLIELIFRYEQAEPVNALEPLSFDLLKGEAVGIIGRNGSGKSTLLSLIAGVLTPSTGSVVARGRISALLELGGGFNPDFSGRENVYFYGAMLGFDRAHMSGIYESIVAFADIGSFIDEPVRTYSTGMFVRLAFAVAISVEPDILIVDEALAVGDVYFQQKCFDRIRDLRRRGTTLLLVSHDSGAIYRFCDRAILLDAGKVIADGKPRDVIETYEAFLIRERDAAANAVVASEPSDAPLQDVTIDNPTINSGEVTLDRVELLTPDGASHLTVMCGEKRILRIALRFSSPVEDPHVGFKLRDRFGSVVYETNTFTMRRAIGPVIPEEYIEIDFMIKLPLVQGEYTITVGVADGGLGEASFQRQLLYVHDVLDFRVLNNPENGIWSGVVDLETQITARRLSSSSLR